MSTGAGTADGFTSAADEAARKATVGTGSGFCHALGMAILMVAEWVRADLDGASAASLASRSYLKDMADRARSLAETGWHRDVSELFEAISFDQPRAALWAAVFMALVVRLNRNGPHQAQRVISLAAAVYCVVGAVALLPYTAAPGEFAFLLLVAFCGGIVRAATR
ncbi:hypothetical protein LRS74_28860 [Streptomyces sp. LX-29]|uniref:hypothetical protein n=1 Tax=Streptomyces sp. LX-29 TaxID=2900152 RepID=UPI00240CF688|nr:hypothetical protein [Streptomyces sp. LX-29]WFB10597.1 hypothetical protein LRS74_28860 [Streptomyces sp. LX-29]